MISIDNTPSRLICIASTVGLQSCSSEIILIFRVREVSSKRFCGLNIFLNFPSVFNFSLCLFLSNFFLCFGKISFRILMQHHFLLWMLHRCLSCLRKASLSYWKIKFIILFSIWHWNIVIFERYSFVSNIGWLWSLISIYVLIITSRLLKLVLIIRIHVDFYSSINFTSFWACSYWITLPCKNIINRTGVIS